MELTDTLNNFSLNELAAKTNKVNREHRFAGIIFVGTGIAISALAAFLMLTGGVAPTSPKVLELIGIPVLYFYIGFLYFKAIKNDVATDWTLANKLKNEKEKMARQIDLYRKLPLHFFLPLIVIIGAGILPDLFDGARGEVSLAKMIIISLTAIFVLGFSLWGLKKAENCKLQPLLKKLETLESQLKEK